MREREEFCRYIPITIADNNRSRDQSALYQCMTTTFYFIFFGINFFLSKNFEIFQFQLLFDFNNNNTRVQKKLVLFLFCFLFSLISTHKSFEKKEEETSSHNRLLLFVVASFIHRHSLLFFSL